LGYTWLPEFLLKVRIRFKP